MTEEMRLVLEKLDKLDAKITDLQTTTNARFADLDAKIADLETSMNAKIASLDAKIANLEASTNARFARLDAKIADLETSMNAKITDLQLTLENETNRNITLIAEGHLDLNQKLDEALKVENEKELLLIRVNVIENEIRKIKARLKEIA